MERELGQLNHEQMNLLRTAVASKLKNCHYCKEKIDFEKDKYGIWNFPTRLICNSPLCVAEVLEDDESNNSRKQTNP